MVLSAIFAWSTYQTNQVAKQIQIKKSQVQPAREPSPSPVGSPFEELIIKKSNFQIQVKYEDNKFKYAGVVTAANPCELIQTDSKILESYPEQVQISVNTQKSDQICAQVIKNKEFAGEVPAPQSSKVKILFNNSPIN